MSTGDRRRRQAVYTEVLRTMNVARRGMGAPVRDAFFQIEIDGRPSYPLASLMSSRSGPGGGRGGKTRVLLYLSLLWVSAGGDYSSSRPASFWASLLGLKDPDGPGSRVVRSSWRELAARGFVTITPGPSRDDPPTIVPLREDGTGRPYNRPEGTGGDTYRRIPQKAWQVLFHAEELSGPGLVMYLVALRTAGKAGHADRLVFPSRYFKTEYGMGESTRKAGLRNLVDLGVLDAETRATDAFGNLGQRRHRRTLYTLLEEYTSPPPAPAPEESASRTRDVPAVSSSEPSEW